MSKPHTRKDSRENTDRRATAARRGYDRKWRKLRAAKLRANPLCERCEKRGQTVAAQEVDHIVPIAGPRDPRRLDWDNLQSLCRDCHQRKTHGWSDGCDEDGWPMSPDHWWNRGRGGSNR